MKNKQKKPFEPRLPKVALNVCKEIAPGKYQIYQFYADMQIPLLGRRFQGEFVEFPANSIDEAFNRLYREYYDG